jgi:hypothetical protein
MYLNKSHYLIFLVFPYADLPASPLSHKTRQNYL